MDILRNTPQDGIIHSDLISDAPGGLNMNGTGELLRYVVIKLHGLCWSIRVHWSFTPEQDVIDIGDTVNSNENIRNVIDCDNEVLSHYYK
jgi:hypothetical protein